MEEQYRACRGRLVGYVGPRCASWWRSFGSGHQGVRSAESTLARRSITATVCNLTMAIPLKSRHASDIIEVTSLVYGRLRSLGLPLHRVHTDRASKEFSVWLRQRNVAHTTTGGDENQGCARAEGELNVLKGRTHLLMDTAKAETYLWPLALRHAAEHRCREQVASLGVRLPRLIPFGSQGMARFKHGITSRTKTCGNIQCKKLPFMVLPMTWVPHRMATTWSVMAGGWAQQLWFNHVHLNQLLDKHWSRFQAVAETDFLAVPDEAQLGDEIFEMVETEEDKILCDEMEIEPCQADVPRLTHSLYMVSNSGRRFFDRSEPEGSGPRKRRSLKKKKEMRKMHTENDVEHNAKTARRSTMRQRWNCCSCKKWER